MKRGETESANRPLVVWVEDDQDFKAMVREWLVPRYDLASYDDGEELLSELDAIEPDVVILDVRLPGPDGFRLCRRLRADRRFSGVPILFLTSCAEDIDYVRHLDVGGTAFLAKPVEKRRLLDTIETLLTEAGRTA